MGSTPLGPLTERDVNFPFNTGRRRLYCKRGLRKRRSKKSFLGSAPSSYRWKIPESNAMGNERNRMSRSPSSSVRGGENSHSENHSQEGDGKLRYEATSSKEIWRKKACLSYHSEKTKSLRKSLGWEECKNLHNNNTKIERSLGKESPISTTSFSKRSRPPGKMEREGKTKSLHLED